MKMVKSLLLGTAAGLVAMTGAQAADLPVKAKPVQYVKICSLYGAGFYYVPGTDTCLKVGGYVRLQTGYGYSGSFTNGPMRASAASNFTRNSNDFNYRVRGYITADARTQTEYGTLRSYIAVGTLTDDAGGGTFNSNRAFVQLAGFTVGLAQSFYDFASMAAVSYNGGSINNTGDTGDGGRVVWGYTAQFGNGFSATLAAQARATTAVSRGAAGAVTVLPTANAAGTNYPDIVANVRLDQAWGSAQIMGALHDASGDYYDATLLTHPGNVMGYAVGAGLRLNAPMIGQGDYFQIQANYAKGATGYVVNPTGYGWSEGARRGYGIVTDGVFGSIGGPTSVELTTAYGVFGSFEHNWNRQWKTSLYGTYVKLEYNGTANLQLCGSVAAVNAGCNNDFSAWTVGSRTAWAPVANLEIGVDILYQRLNTASNGVVIGGLTTENRDAWLGHLRVQRNFYP